MTLDIAAILEWNDADARLADEVESHPLMRGFRCKTGRLLSRLAEKMRP